jgi:hypothetical protein
MLDAGGDILLEGSGQFMCDADGANATVVGDGGRRGVQRSFAIRYWT